MNNLSHEMEMSCSHICPTCVTIEALLPVGVQSTEAKLELSVEYKDATRNKNIYAFTSCRFTSTIPGNQA